MFLEKIASQLSNTV